MAERLSVKQLVVGSIPTLGAMEILEYFEEEYKNILSKVDETSLTIVQSKQLIVDLIEIEKQMINLLFEFKLSNKNLDKLLQIVESLAVNARNLLNSSMSVKDTIQKTMTY